MTEPSRVRFPDGVQGCLTSGEYSDLAIKCGEDVYKVHKVIVCSQSGFFDKAIKFGGKEANEDIVELPDDEPEVIASLLKYLYTGEYDGDFSVPPKTKQATPLIATNIKINRTIVRNTYHKREYTYEFPHTCKEGECVDWLLCPHHKCTSSTHIACKNFFCAHYCSVRVPGHPSQLLSHSKMYAIADKYDVTGLKELASKKFKLTCEAFWDEDAFPVAIDHVFSATVSEDIGMRRIVIQTISKNMALVHKPEIQGLITQYGDLAIGVLLKKTR